MGIEQYAIEYLKSGLSVNTHIGCGLGCKYCVLSTGIYGFPNNALQVNSPRNIVNWLNNPLTMFANGLTPIYINNRTDPFLPDVIESTYELLDLMVHYNIVSPIILISKLAPDKRFNCYTSKLNILYFYTYSGLTGIDYNSDDQINQATIKEIIENVSYNNRFHYFRPVIPGFNDSVDTVHAILKKVKGIFRLTVSGGIRLNIENSKLFNVSKFDKNHKLFSDNVWSIIIQQAKEMDHPVVRHTSCAIAIFMNNHNNLRYYCKQGHCVGSLCVCYEHCKNGNIVDFASIEAFLAQHPMIKYNWDNDSNLLIESPISQELLAFIRSTYGARCIASEILLSPSERQITK